MAEILSISDVWRVSLCVPFWLPLSLLRLFVQLPPRHAKLQTVFVTFVNHTSQEREVLVGDEKYQIPYNSQVHVSIPVGSVVRVYSSTNSKVNGQALMQVSANDNESAVFLK